MEIKVAMFHSLPLWKRLILFLSIAIVSAELIAASSAVAQSETEEQRFFEWGRILRESKSENERYAAIVRINQSEPPDRRQYQYNRIGLEDPSPQVREVAASFLYSDDQKEFVPQLIKVMAKDVSPRVRMTAALSLSRFYTSNGTDGTQDANLIAQNIELVLAALADFNTQHSVAEILGDRYSGPTVLPCRMSKEVRGRIVKALQDAIAKGYPIDEIMKMMEDRPEGGIALSTKYLGDALENTLSCDQESAKREEPAKGECKFSNLPADFEIHLVSTYAGFKDVDVQLDKSGHQAKEIEVIVNKPDRSILLVLSAYDPVVWHVRYTPNTRIVGVLAGGYHGQAVLGIPKSTTLLLATYEGEVEGKGNCPYFYISRSDDPESRRKNSLEAVSARIETLTGRVLHQFYNEPIGDRFVIGAPEINPSELRYSTDRTLVDFEVKTDIPTGRKGIEYLVAEGKLRKIKKEDVDLWRSINNRKVQDSGKAIPPFSQNDYLVISKLTLPEGLHGGYAVLFVVPRGVSQPDGPRGHNRFVFFDADCTSGTTCRE